MAVAERVSAERGESLGDTVSLAFAGNGSKHKCTIVQKTKQILLFMKKLKNSLILFVAFELDFKIGNIFVLPAIPQQRFFDRLVSKFD